MKWLIDPSTPEDRFVEGVCDLAHYPPNLPEDWAPLLAALPRLVDLLYSGPGDPARDILGRIGEPCLETLRRELGSRPGYDQRHVLEALVRCGGVADVARILADH